MANERVINRFDLDDSGDVVKEDVMNYIYNITPRETVMLSLLGRGKARSTKREWFTRELAGHATNKHLEGAAFAADGTAPPDSKRMFNYTQISKKEIRISGTAEEVEKYGRSSEVRFQMADALAGS
ncbi:MAG: DUF5309 domain-containing protein [Myxococcales bacterium]|nr:DUF5309 domain-containing protein [Myxococcales bacterium]